MNYKIAFLDRDGTINKDKNYIYKIDDFEFLPGVISGLKKLQQNGFLLVIVTNQSGVARGYYKEEDIQVLHKWMFQELEKSGVSIAKVYYCPHLPDATIEKYRKNCNCRKPKTELYYKAISELKRLYDLDLANSVAIGDKIRDLSICNELSIKGYLIDSDYHDALITGVKDFKSAIDIIVKEKVNEN